MAVDQAAVKQGWGLVGQSRELAAGVLGWRMASRPYFLDSDDCVRSGQRKAFVRGQLEDLEEVEPPY